MSFSERTTYVVTCDIRKSPACKVKAHTWETSSRPDGGGVTMNYGGKRVDVCSDCYPILCDEAREARRTEREKLKE